MATGQPEGLDDTTLEKSLRSLDEDFHLMKIYKEGKGFFLFSTLYHRCNELMILTIDQIERIMDEPLPKIDPKSTIGRSFCQLALLPSEISFTITATRFRSHSISKDKLSTL